MQKGRVAVALLLIAVAIAFIVIGINNNQVEDVLLKSTFICLECIGIG